MEDGKLTFEAHAYEALLTTAKTLETQEFNTISSLVSQVLVYFKTGSLLPIEIQEKMRMLKNALVVMRGRIEVSRRLLQELTEDDEEMALMNLTYLAQKAHLYNEYPLSPEILGQHDAMEELLESYLLDCNALLTKIVHVKSQIQNSEDLVSLRLDTSRNELLIANTALTVLACSIGFSAYITGIFGMNLDNVNMYQNESGLFAAITTVTMALIVIIFCSIMFYLRKTGMIPTYTKNMIDMDRPMGVGHLDYMRFSTT